MQQHFYIQEYCRELLEALLAHFGDRLCYLGLQGSHLLGEATAESDIDILLILDTLTLQDMNAYRTILAEVGHAEKACGFLCSRSDLANWNPLEICQLPYTTKDLYGTLADFLPAWSLADEANYIKLSLNNLYHALCHSYVHGDRHSLTQELPMHYKSAFFILQNTHFLETYRSEEQEAEFILSKADLIKKLHGEDKAVLQALLDFTNGEAVDFEKHFSLLFSWCQHKMANLP